MAITVRTGKREANEMKSNATKNANSNEKLEFPPREWVKLDIGGLKARPGDYGEMDAVCTALKFQRPFKGSHDQTKPLHILEFFDPSTGEEFSMVIDTKLNKKGKLRQDFFGGLLLNLGKRVPDDDVIETYEWYDPTKHDVKQCGGAFALDQSLFGRPIIIGREAKEIVGERTVTLQVFYYDTYTDEKAAELFPNLDEYVMRYNEDGSYTDEYLAEWNASQGGAEEGNNAETEEAIQIAIDLLNEGKGKLAAIHEIQGLVECGMDAAKDVVFEAAKRIEKAGAEKAPAKKSPAKKAAPVKMAVPDEPEEDYEAYRERMDEEEASEPEPAPEKAPGPKISRAQLVNVASGRIKNGAKNSELLKELKDDYGQSLSDAKEILKEAQKKVAGSDKAAPASEAGAKKSGAAKARVRTEKTKQPEPEPAPEEVDDIDEDDDGPSPLQIAAKEALDSGKSKAAVIKELMSEFELDQDIAKQVVESVLDSEEPTECPENDGASAGEENSGTEGNWLTSLFEGRGVPQGQRNMCIDILNEEIDAGNTAKGAIAKRLVGAGLPAKIASAIAGDFVARVKEL